MFRCEKCKKVSQIREKINNIVTEKRDKIYRIDNGKDVIEVQGWEIVKEINVCRECYDKREVK